MSPSHPDRVRRNYQKRIAFIFKDIPFHICEKAPLYPPIYLLNSNMKECPYCFEKIQINEKDTSHSLKMEE